MLATHAKAVGIPLLPVYTGRYDHSAFEGSYAVAVINPLADGDEMVLIALQGELAS